MCVEFGYIPYKYENNHKQQPKLQYDLQKLQSQSSIGRPSASSMGAQKMVSLSVVGQQQHHSAADGSGVTCSHCGARLATASPTLSNHLTADSTHPSKSTANSITAAKQEKMAASSSSFHSQSHQNNSTVVVVTSEDEAGRDRPETATDTADTLGVIGMTSLQPRKSGSSSSRSNTSLASPSPQGSRQASPAGSAVQRLFEASPVQIQRLFLEHAALDDRVPAEERDVARYLLDTYLAPRGRLMTAVDEAHMGRVLDGIIARDYASAATSGGMMSSSAVSSISTGLDAIPDALPHSGPNSGDNSPLPDLLKKGSVVSTSEPTRCGGSAIVSSVIGSTMTSSILSGGGGSVGASDVHAGHVVSYSDRFAVAGVDDSSEGSTSDSSSEDSETSTEDEFPADFGLNLGILSEDTQVEDDEDAVGSGADVLSGTESASRGAKLGTSSHSDALLTGVSASDLGVGSPPPKKRHSMTTRDALRSKKRLRKLKKRKEKLERKRMSLNSGSDAAASAAAAADDGTDGGSAVKKKKKGKKKKKHSKIPLSSDGSGGRKYKRRESMETLRGILSPMTSAKSIVSGSFLKQPYSWSPAGSSTSLTPGSSATDSPMSGMLSSYMIPRGPTTATGLSREDIGRLLKDVNDWQQFDVFEYVDRCGREMALPALMITLCHSHRLFATTADQASKAREVLSKGRSGSLSLNKTSMSALMDDESREKMKEQSEKLRISRQPLEIDELKLMKYLYEISLQYRDNPYHNIYHSCDVVVSMAYFMNSCIFDNIDTFDKFAILISAAVHDVGHPGHNNAFEVNTESELSVTYNDKSVLENYHIALAWRLMRRQHAEAMDIDDLASSADNTPEVPLSSHSQFSSASSDGLIASEQGDTVSALATEEPRVSRKRMMRTSDTNFLEYFTKEETKRFREVMIVSILATDMAEHTFHLEKLEELIEKKDSVWEYDTFAINFLPVTLHTADLANPCKPLKLYEKWTDRVMSEFFAQGDREKSLGLPVSFLCDRNIVNIGSGQVGFINFVIRPWWNGFAKLLDEPKQGPLFLECLETNGLAMQILADKEKEEKAAMAAAAAVDAGVGSEDEEYVLDDAEEGDDGPPMGVTTGDVAPSAELATVDAIEIVTDSTEPKPSEVGDLGVESPEQRKQKSIGTPSANRMMEQSWQSAIDAELEAEEDGDKVRTFENLDDAVAGTSVSMTVGSKHRSDSMTTTPKKHRRRPSHSRKKSSLGSSGSIGRISEMMESTTPSAMAELARQTSHSIVAASFDEMTQRLVDDYHRITAQR